MALNRKSLPDRELNKFVESPNRPGEPAVDTVSSGVFDAPINTDAVVRSVVGPVETWEFKSGGISGSVVKTVTVTYTDITLVDILNVVIT